MRTTNLFIIIDEVTLETVKGSNGLVVKFETKKGAEFFASNRLHIWQVVNIHFHDKFIEHNL